MHQPLRVFLLMFFVASTAAALDCQAQSERRNGAYWYQRAIDDYQAATGQLTDEQWDTFWNYEHGEPGPQVRSMLSRVGSAFQHMHRGASTSYSDFHLDYDQGIDLLLPHLSDMRGLARWARVDAFVRMNDGDSAGAAKQISTLYQMAEHTSHDDILISSLVGMAVFAHADEASQFAFDNGIFTELDAGTLLNATMKLDANDPFRIVDAMIVEQEVFVHEFMQRFVDQNDEQLRENIRLIINVNEEEADEFANQFAEGGIDREIAQFDDMMNQVIDAFMMEDPEAATEKLAELEDRLVDGEFGVMAELLAPAYTKVHERMLQSKELVAARRAMLEEIVKGEKTLLELENAAPYYLRAADAIAALTEAQQELIRNNAKAIDPETADLLQVALNECEVAIEQAKAGAALQRCSFESYWNGNPMQIAPPYIVKLHRLLQFLQADAAHALRYMDNARLSNRLFLLIRLYDHIGCEGPLMESIVAQHSLKSTYRIFELAMLGELLDDDARTQLGEAARRVDRVDPLGFVRAIALMRERADRICIGAAQHNDPEKFAAAKKMLLRLKPDDLLHIAILESATPESYMNVWETAGKIVEGTTEVEAAALTLVDDEHFASMSDVFDLAALGEICHDAQRMMVLQRREDTDFFRDRPAINFADANKRYASVRQDWRKVLKLLKPVEEEASEEESATKPAEADKN